MKRKVTDKNGCIALAGPHFQTPKERITAAIRVAERVGQAEFLFFVARQRRARDSNPQLLTEHLISNEAASHSLTLQHDRWAKKAQLERLRIVLDQTAEG